LVIDTSAWSVGSGTVAAALLFAVFGSSSFAVTLLVSVAVPLGTLTLTVIVAEVSGAIAKIAGKIVHVAEAPEPLHANADEEVLTIEPLEAESAT
jgi:hypothetical protein